MSASEVRIGTRGSALALAQARLVAEALDRAGYPSRFVVIETDGDRRQPDTAWGEGAFVAAIEQALLDDRVDLAVHSAKDVPTDQGRWDTTVGHHLSFPSAPFCTHGVLITHHRPSLATIVDRR